MNFEPTLADADQTEPRIRAAFCKLSSAARGFLGELLGPDAAQRPDAARAAIERLGGAPVETSPVGDRYCDEKGIPVIPGLGDQAMICFAERVNLARDWEMDSALTVLEGVADLCQHHPALQPEVAAIREMCAAWFDVLTELRGAVRAIAAQHPLRLFWNRAEEIAESKLERGMELLAELYILVQHHPELARQAAAIVQLNDGWKAIRDSAVLERCRRV